MDAKKYVTSNDDDDDDDDARWIRLSSALGELKVSTKDVVTLPL